MNFFIHHKYTKSTKELLFTDHASRINRTIFVNFVSSWFKKESL